MRDALVFQILDKVDGEKTFADASFAIDYEDEFFHEVCGVNFRIRAMRGPRAGFLD